MLDEDAMYESLSDIPVIENRSQVPAQVAHSKPLVLRPAVVDVPATEVISQQLALVTQSRPLVQRPAVPELAVQQSPTTQQLSIIQQPSRTAESYRTLL